MDKASEQNYTKRELDDHFGVVNCKLDEISERVKNTNGRVKQLEIWRAGIVGALGVITAIVIPMLMYIYFEKLGSIQTETASLSEKISSIQKILSDAEITQ